MVIKQNKITSFDEKPTNKSSYFTRKDRSRAISRRPTKLKKNGGGGVVTCNSYAIGDPVRILW